MSYVSEPFTYPGGGLAVGVPVKVFHNASNVLAPIYWDAGVTRKINPTKTSDSGTVAFWIEPGTYDLVANGVRTPVTISGSSGGGPGGSGTHVHVQSPASNIWVIDHLLGTMPSVDIVDVSGNEIWAEIDYPSTSRVVITFAAPRVGTAYLRT